MATNTKETAVKASPSKKSANNLQKKFNNYFSSYYRWFLGTPERALERAYRAALLIKSIEDEHFGGQLISADSGNLSKNVLDYWQSELEKNLSTVKVRVAEFKTSRLIVHFTNPSDLEKLQLIDDVIEKYAAAKKAKAIVLFSDAEQIARQSANNQSYSSDLGSDSKMGNISDEKGILPRSIGSTIKRIKRELDPKAEEEVVKKFRSSSWKTRKALTFVVILITVPILTQQLSKHFVFTPLVEHYKAGNPSLIFLNGEMKEEAFKKLHEYEEELKFDSLIKASPEISAESIKDKVKHKADELVEEFRHESRDAISNIFADLAGIVAFGTILVTCKRQIIILKSFIDDVAYGLSDTAKAFIIILLTDSFVGFHSPHGWEVILEGMAKHLGVVANHSMISLFIATVPVILDCIFKYWIFRYLSQMSPSALATLKGMKE